MEEQEKMEKNEREIAVHKASRNKEEGGLQHQISGWGDAANRGSAKRVVEQHENSEKEGRKRAKILKDPPFL